jgi:hypothetical protein
MMWMLQNKDTNEIVDPRTSVDFPLSPNDIYEGATDWDEVFAIESETDVVDGFAKVWVENGEVASR